jgi:hypothetical protein
MDNSRFTMIGKKVKNTQFTEENLTFILEDGTKITYNAVGDCCSSSYIESIDDLDVLQNCEILEMQAVSGEEKEVSDYDFHKWTFYKFKTTKGYATLSFRNESNGYYDGYLELDKGNWQDSLVDKDYN